MNPSPNPNKLKAANAYLKGFVVACEQRQCRIHHLMPEGAAGLMPYRPHIRCIGRWLCPSHACRRWSTPPCQISRGAVAAIAGTPAHVRLLRRGALPSTARRSCALAKAACNSGEKSSMALSLLLRCGWCRRCVALLARSGGKVKGRGTKS